MVEWFEFALYALSSLVETVFSWDLGLGFSFGDFQVALLVIVVIVSALLVKSTHIGERIYFSPGAKKNE